jgi:hypothetical protein
LRKIPERLTLALLVSALVHCQAQTRAVVTGSRVRAEATLDAGQLRERFLAHDGSAWVDLAFSSGETVSALSIRNSSGTLRSGAVTGLSFDGNHLAEDLVIDNLRVRRTLSLTASEHWLKVTTRLTAGFPATLHSFSDRLRAAMQPDWSYAPSVGGFIPDAQYKAPLILVQSGRRALGIVPDLAALTRDGLRRSNHALDLDASAEPILSVGFIPARQAYHSVYREDFDRAWIADQPIENSYYIYLSADAAPREAYRDAVRFHWEQFARKEMEVAAAGQSATDPQYQQCGVWDDWRSAIWDRESPGNWLSFTLPDGSTGGAVRMIRWGAPNPSVYLGSWFNSLRTAYGMALYARRTGKPGLMNLARQTLQMALQAPGKDGAFQCIAVPHGNGSSVSWAAGDGSGGSTVHGFLGFDMSWTGYWMLRWRAAGLPGSEGTVDRCARLAAFLIARQEPDGLLPTRFDADGAVERDAARMLQAETAPVALFLLELYKASPKSEYLTAARKGLAFLDREVVASRKWYDFETFWSCSPRLIAFDGRTRQWPANNLALIHATAAYLAAYQVTREPAYLERGQALLDYLLLYQQSWTNPVLEGLTGPAMLLGGFTTQNSDAEWSDARQSLAGNVLIDYYHATGNAEYLERGVEALRAQFPISPSENWAHVGYGAKAGVSSFHWGSGSGMAGIEIDEEYLRDAVLDAAAERGVGVNGLNLTGTEVRDNRIQFHLDSPFPWGRNPVVVFRHTQPDQMYQVTVNDKLIGSYLGKTLEAGLTLQWR